MNTPEKLSELTADLREQIARVIEPNEFVWEGFKADTRLRDRALAKADAILALVNPRAETAEAEVARLKADAARLDFLDEANRCLNATYGTTYNWKLIMNHNVNRLMIGHLYVDLNDAEPHAAASCREAIDEKMREVVAARAAVARAEEPSHDR